MSVAFHFIVNLDPLSSILVAMDAAEIARLIKELDLSQEAEVNAIELPQDLTNIILERAAKCLVLKIFSARSMNREAVRTQVPRIIQARKRVDVELVGDNLFVCDFAAESDRQTAIRDGPWNFFKCLMLFKEPKELQNPSEVVFDDISLWVQCHNIPITCMDPLIVRHIGERLGKVEDVDIDESGKCVGKFARIRVTRPLFLPLLRCASVRPYNSNQSAVILLTYERLLDFCHACGRVGHVLRECSDDKADKVAPIFGDWMRAGKAGDAQRSRSMPTDSIKSTTEKEARKPSPTI